MSTNQDIPDNSRIYIKWFFSASAVFLTLTNAFLLPYMAVAGALALSILLGVFSLSELRELTMQVAHKDYASWSVATETWLRLSLDFSFVYLVWIVVRMDIAQRYITHKLDMLKTWLESDKSHPIIALAILLSFGTVFIYLTEGHKPHTTTKNLIAYKNNQTASASIILDDGKMISGNAQVIKKDDAYIITFKH